MNYWEAVRAMSNEEFHACVRLFVEPRMAQWTEKGYYLVLRARRPDWRDLLIGERLMEKHLQASVPEQPLWVYVTAATDRLVYVQLRPLCEALRRDILQFRGADRCRKLPSREGPELCYIIEAYHLNHWRVPYWPEPCEGVAQYLVEAKSAPACALPDSDDEWRYDGWEEFLPPREQAPDPYIHFRVPENECQFDNTVWADIFPDYEEYLNWAED